MQRVWSVLKAEDVKAMLDAMGAKIERTYKPKKK